MKISTEVNAKVSEVIERLHAAYGHVDALRDRLTAVEERNHQLEQEQTRVNQFAIDKLNYLQVAIGPDAFAHVHINDMAKSYADVPKVCVNCYHDSKIKPLQFTRYEGAFKVLICNECKQEIKFPHGIKHEIISAPKRDRDF